MRLKNIIQNSLKKERTSWGWRNTYLLNISSSWFQHQALRQMGFFYPLCFMLTTSRHSLRELFGGRGEQWHNINITSSTAYKNWSLIPLSFEQQTTPFVTSARAETSWLIFSFSCSVIQGRSFQFPTNCFPAQEKYPQEQALVLEIHRAGEGGKSVLLQLLSTQTFNLFVFHSSALSFGEHLRIGQLQAYKDFFCSGLKGSWYNYVWRRQGAKGHF